MKRRIIAALVSSPLLIASCGSSEGPVYVDVTFEAAPGRRLDSVSVVSGSDRYHWAELRAGKRATVTLRPQPRDDRRLALVYWIDGRQRSWQATAPEPGRGHRISVIVDEAGTVRERHCVLPCTLD